MNNIIPQICQNVEVRSGSVYDHKTDRSFQLNPISEKILEYCDGTNNIGQITEKICADCEVAEDEKAEVSNDVREFILTSNSQYLVNCIQPGISGVLRSLFLAEKYYKRIDINSESPFLVFAHELLIVGKMFSGAAAVALLLPLIISAAAVLAGLPAAFAFRIIGIVFSFLLGALIGTVLHETTHVLLYRRKEPKGGFMVKKGLSLMFVRKIFNETFLTKICGGGISGLIGIAGIILYLCGVPCFHNIFCLFFSIGLSVQLLNLLPISGDGKEIFNLLLMKILRG